MDIYKKVKENNKKITGFVVILLATFGITYFYLGGGFPVERGSKEYFAGDDLSQAQDITCTYKQTVTADYFEDNISHKVPKQETNPLIFTFSDFDKEISKLSFIDATRTITTVPIVKIYEDDFKLVFIDGAGENYMTVHTIWKDRGIGTYAKNVDILGSPFATLAMGSCVGY